MGAGEGPLRETPVVSEILTNVTTSRRKKGDPLSPLLANILLDDLDHELERRGHRFARYADDLLVLVKTTRASAQEKTA